VLPKILKRFPELVMVLGVACAIVLILLQLEPKPVEHLVAG
jgi:hypothetical protein